MKKLLVLCIPVVLIISCTKDQRPNPPTPPSHPQMRYTELNNTAINFNQLKQIDMDSDGYSDLLFSTMTVGDPILGVDKHVYFVNSALHVSLLINELEQTPVVNHGDSIKLDGHRESHWYNANAITFAQKIISNTETHWEGNWKDAEHKYVSVQILKNGLRYNGWVEISFNTNAGQMILHRAAISLEAEKIVSAGF
jgi:hypothetical protein